MGVRWTEDELLPLSGVQHFAFCPRQWALIHIEQQWLENERTAEGRVIHSRCHDDAIREKRGTVIVVRGLRVTSWELGLTGVCDVVEFQKSAEGTALANEEDAYCPIPVEYKKGRKKIGDEDRLQLCAQAIALREMFCCEVPQGYLYYASSRHRELVEFSDALRSRVIDVAKEMHRYFADGYTPKPRRKRPCNSCSLVDICSPEIGETVSVDAYMRNALESLAK